MEGLGGVREGHHFVHDHERGVVQKVVQPDASQPGSSPWARHGPVMASPSRAQRPRPTHITKH